MEPQKQTVPSDGKQTRPQRRDNRQGGRRSGGMRSLRPHKGKMMPRRIVETGKKVTETAHIPPPKEDSIRIMPLGGVEEIGRNMTAFEFRDSIIIVDIGFQFKEENTPGIDYILPNTKYLEERKDKIKAVAITHGHLDHIGGIPYIMDKIGNPPIYSRKLTTLFILKRQEEFPHSPKLDTRIVEKEDTIEIAPGLKLRFFAVSHAIPDSMGVIIETPYGSIVHTGDLRLDHVDGVPTAKEDEAFSIFEKENVLLLVTDSTNVENPGFAIPEPVVWKTIDKIVAETPGRLFVGTFASQLERAMKIIESAERHGRKVVVEGRSMKTNIEVAKEAGYLKHKENTVIPIEDVDSYPPNKVMVLATGAQGEEFAALMRVSNKTHRHLKLNRGDTVLLSSSVVPGNERSVQRLKDNLSRQGAHIIHYQSSDVHSSGHANHDELLWIHKKIKPKFFIPAHGYHYMLSVHAELAEGIGMPRTNIIIPDNGMIIEIQEGGKRIVTLPEKIPSNIVLVDGFSVGNIQEVVLRDRQMLAQDGIFVIIATVDLNTRKLKKSPDIISRGFVYLRESQGLLHDTRTLVRKTVEDMVNGARPINFDYVGEKVTDEVERFLLQKTAKRPMVIPVILSI